MTDLSTHQEPPGRRAANPDEAAQSLAAITLGIDHLRELALADTADDEDQATVLMTLHGGDARETGALPLLADLISDIALRLRDTTDGEFEEHIEGLDEAAAFVADYAGRRINRATRALTDQLRGET